MARSLRAKSEQLQTQYLTTENEMTDHNTGMNQSTNSTQHGAHAEIKRYLAPTLQAVGVLLNTNGAWQFRFPTPVDGFDTTSTFQSAESAVDAFYSVTAKNVSSIRAA